MLPIDFEAYLLLIQNGPELLPRDNMLKLFTYMVGTTSGMIQQMASQAVMDLAECSNGDEGCTTATQQEIDVLMEALQAPALPVREVTLQVTRYNHRYPSGDPTGKQDTIIDIQEVTLPVNKLQS